MANLIAHNISLIQLQFN